MSDSPSRQGWRTVKVFLSSTFRDMHAERDYLIKVVFPDLRQWCEQRRLHLVDIDLRWGVTEAEANNGKAIDICLKEIDGSRPFFVCILGERYGFVPERLPPEELYRFTGIQAVTHKSITHLEIMHATEEPLVRLQPPPAGPVCPHAFFYLRKPECLPAPATLKGTLTEPQVQEYQSAYFEPPPQRGERDRSRQLRELKDNLRQRLGSEGGVHDYEARFDPTLENPEDDKGLQGRFTDLDMFGRLVKADLMRAIELQFADRIRAASEPVEHLAEERALHEAFIENRTQVHVPRIDIENLLTHHMMDDDHRVLVLAGPPGSGKSSILAHWLKENVDLERYVARWDRKTHVFARFIGASPSSTSLPRLLADIATDLVQTLGLEEAVENGIPGGPKTQRLQPIDVPREPAHLQAKWPLILESAAAKGPVLLVLDAVNQLDHTGGPMRLHWLPMKLPVGMRIVVSVLDHGEHSPPNANDEPTDWLAALRRREIRELDVGALTDVEQRAIIRQLPSVFCKTLDPAHVDELMRNRAMTNPLFLIVALEELRVFGGFKTLAQRIAALPKLVPAQPGLMSERMIDDALDELFGQVLDRLDREAAVRHLPPALFCLLGSAREGLSERELDELLASRLENTDAERRAGTMQVVLRQLRSYLMRKGSVIDFYHRSFWKAVRTKYLNDGGRRRENHARLAKYFDAQPNEQNGSPNPRKSTELIWQRLRMLEAAPRDASAAPDLSFWAPLERHFQDQEFLEAKSSAGLGHEIINEFHQAYFLLGDARRTLAQKAIHGLLNLFLAHSSRSDGVLKPVSVHSMFAYRSDDKELYKALLQTANSPDWLAQVTDRAAGERFALEALNDYLDLLRREGNVEEAGERLPPILRRLEELSHFQALGRSEYSFAYLHFLRGDLDEAARIFEQSAEHSFQATPPNTLGGWVSRCLQHRAAYLGDQIMTSQFRTVLQQARDVFTAAPDSEFAQRWVMNTSAHLFEIAFAETDIALARRLFDDLQDTHWMQDKPQALTRYRAALAMLEGKWSEAARLFSTYLDIDHPKWNSKKEEALARECLDYGIALAEAGQAERAKSVWRRGLACPDQLGNRIWKVRISEAMALIESHGACWTVLPRPVKR